ncbi:conserved hypothetical protein, partial [Ricinus communis]
RDHAHRRFAPVGKAHAQVEPVGRLVGAHHVQEWRFAAPQLAQDQLFHQLPGQAAALEIGMDAHAADFAQAGRGHPLPGHRDQPAAVVEVAEVVAQFDGARAERPRPGQRGQFHRLRRMFAPERHGVRRRVRRRRAAVPDHAVHGGLGLDAPAIRRRSGPAIAVEVLSRLAERAQCVEIRRGGIGKADDGRKAGGVAARAGGAGGETGVRPAQRLPEDIVEKVVHGTGDAAKPAL